MHLLFVNIVLNFTGVWTSWSIINRYSAEVSQTVYDYRSHEVDNIQASTDVPENLRTG